MKELSIRGDFLSIQNISGFNTNSGYAGEAEILATILLSERKKSNRMKLATQLLKNFGNLRSIFAASREELMEFGALKSADLHRILKISNLIGAVLRSEICEKPLLNNLDKVMDYCHALLADKSREQFDCLFLDKSLRLLAHNCIQVGTTDHVAVYPRELMARALRHNASAIILVHNHPSTNANPSKDDISMTEFIVKIGKMLGITVADHIIVSRKEVFSFKKEALI